MVFEKEYCLHYKSIETLDPQGRGLGWHDLCWGPLDIATYQINKRWTLMFQRRRF